MLPYELPERFTALFDDVTTKWANGRPLQVIKLLAGGKSGASVTIVDIGTSLHAGDQAFRSGHYVLKLDERRPSTTVEIAPSSEPGEHERHLEATKRSAEFAKRHIPALAQHLEIGTSTRQLALLYEIAGDIYSDIVSAFDVTAGPLGKCCKLVSRDILKQFNHDFTIAPTSAKNLLAEWLGYRLDPSSAPALHEFLHSLTGGRDAFPLAGEVLLSPLLPCSAPIPDTNLSACYGFIHGDLHPGNILLRHDDTNLRDYWLIDFALFRRAPLFYDHAYLEFAILDQNMRGLGVERLYGLLRALDATARSIAASNVPPADIGVLDAVREIRVAAMNWHTTVAPGRADSYKAQTMLARVAVGINWANKPLETPRLIMAAAYASWFTKQYIQRFHRKEAAGYLAKTHSGAAPRKERDENEVISHVIDHAEPDTWDRLWKELDKFDESVARFILVAGNLGHIDSKSLGLLPWTAIIDLDSESDQAGLLSKA